MTGRPGQRARIFGYTRATWPQPKPGAPKDRAAGHGTGGRAADR